MIFRLSNVLEYLALPPHHIPHRLAQHLHRKLIIRLDLQRLVVIRNRSIDLKRHMMHEPQTKQRVWITRVDVNAFLKKLDCLRILLHLPVTMGQVAHYRLDYPSDCALSTRYSTRKVLLGLLVVLDLVVEGAHLVEHEGVCGVDLVGGLKGIDGGLVVETEVLHSHVEVGGVGSGEETGGCSVKAHGLV